MSREPWTEEQIKRLKQLFPHYVAGDLAIEELMKVLDKPYHGVLHKARQLGLTKHEPQMDEELYKKLCKKLEI